MSETIHTSALIETATTRGTRAIRWTRERTALLALVCLLAGTAGGWSIRGLRSRPG